MIAISISQKKSYPDRVCGIVVCCRSCATSLFLPHFDVIRDVLLNGRIVTWNLFVKYSYYTSSALVSNKYYPYSTCPNTMLARRSAIKRIIYVSTLHLGTVHFL